MRPFPPSLQTNEASPVDTNRLMSESEALVVCGRIHLFFGMSESQTINWAADDYASWYTAELMNLRCF